MSDPTSPDPAHDPEALAGAEDQFRRQVMAGLSPTLSAVHGKAFLEEYDRRGERLKTLELGLLAALMPGLDGPTKDQLGRKMRELAGLDENREPR